jgi:uncharacterized protein (TIGR00162 family)
MIRADGSSELLKHEIHSWKNPEGGPDLILYTGDAQPVTPEAEYELADKAVEICRELGAQTLYTLAAYITGRFVEAPRVFGTATDRETAGSLVGNGITLMTEGTITGMNGVLVGIAKVKGLRGICLLGETSGYIVDPKASQAVLEALSRLLGIKVDLSMLEDRAKQTEAFLKNLEEMRRTPGGPAPPRPPTSPGYIS